MTLLKVYFIRLRFLLLFFMIFSFCLVLADEIFGEVEGEADEKTEWGGSVFSNTEGLKIKYKDNTETDYSGVQGKITTSEYGKISEAEVDVKRDGEYVFGNYKVNLKAGSNVIFKDGELHIENPKSMIKKDDVEFVDTELGFGSEESIKLSGEGVDYMDLEEVNLDSFGYFLSDPEGVRFDDFEVYGKGKVYFLDDGKGEANFDVPGAYISVNEGEKRFTIGSSVSEGVESYIAVKVNEENKYGLKHDENSDFIAFKSVGGMGKSYLTVQDRTHNGLIPTVHTVGHYAIDNNHMSVFKGLDGNIYTNLEGSSFAFSKGSGSTPSPIELHSFKFGESGEIESLNYYSGAVVIGNDGALAYNVNSDAEALKWTPGGRYLDGRAEISIRVPPEMRFGVSNLISYNEGVTKEALESVFNVNLHDPHNYLGNPANARMMYDLFARIPKGTLATRSISLSNPGRGAAGLAWSDGRIQSIFSLPVIAHEIGHIFDWYGGMSQDWKAIKGYSPPHTVRYGAYRSVESVSTVFEYILQGDDYWSNIAAGGGYRNSPETSIRMAAKIAVIAKHGGINDYDAARILKNFDISVNPSNPVDTYNDLIRRVAGGNT